MYKNDVSKEMVEEMMLLKKIRHANLGDVQMSPLQLLNKLHDARLESLFPNVCISLTTPCHTVFMISFFYIHLHLYMCFALLTIRSAVNAETFFCATSWSVPTYYANE
eukprot:Em0001g2579a